MLRVVARDATERGYAVAIEVNPLIPAHRPAIIMNKYSSVFLSGIMKFGTIKDSNRFILRGNFLKQSFVHVIIPMNGLDVFQVFQALD